MCCTPAATPMSRLSTSCQQTVSGLQMLSKQQVCKTSAASPILCQSTACRQTVSGLHFELKRVQHLGCVPPVSLAEPWSDHQTPRCVSVGDLDTESCLAQPRIVGTSDIQQPFGRTLHVTVGTSRDSAAQNDIYSYMTDVRRHTCSLAVTTVLAEPAGAAAASFLGFRAASQAVSSRLAWLLTTLSTACVQAFDITQTIAQQSLTTWSTRPGF